MVVQTNLENMLPNSEEFGKYFHELFKQPSENQRKRIEWKKLKKKGSKCKDKRKNKLELLNDSGSNSPPEIELPGNASAFAVFASVRLAVLERWMRQATQEYLQSSCSIPLHDLSEIDSDTEDNSQSTTYLPLRVSKIVGLGLRSVFELIRESRSSHPTLCTKALRALLDVLQGQTPEGLKGEPPEVVEPLFQLLLELATSLGPETAWPNDGSHLTAVACACLLALVVVRGDSGNYLAAVAALLMSPRALANQNIQMPAVLTSLQRSVHGVLLGKVIRPDWITHGILHSSVIDCYHVRAPPDLQGLVPKSLASDGQFLYLFSNRGLLKIGTGYGGTMKGHVYLWKQEFYTNDKGWIGFCNNHLYLKLTSRRNTELLKIERDGLHFVGTVTLDHKDFNACVIFSDGDNLGTIAPAKDDGFIVRTLNVNTNPAVLVNELPLKLARKCMDVLGIAAFEEEGVPNPVNTGTDDEIATICAGKEFGLIRTTTGKVLYCGKASALGIKQSGVRTSKWCELTVSKCGGVTHVAIGHDGSHGVLLTEDGWVFFTGTARRGEDGDQSKARRQPKPVKPKKMVKVDGQFVVHAACNNGSTALVTRDGELLMFGKDTAHADHLYIY